MEIIKILLLLHPTITTTVVSIDHNQPTTSSSSRSSFSKPFQLTFTQGFIAGQLSFLLLVLCFLRYVVFEDPKARSKPIEPQRNQKIRHNVARRSSHKHSRRLSFHDKSHATTISDVLSKLPYDLSSHPPETTDWLNVLLAQAIVAYRSLVHGLDDDPTMPKGNKAKAIVEEAMNFARGESPGVISVDHITVTEVNFGKEYPTCTNARVRPADETGRMRIEIDVDYSDHVTLAIETKVVINFPTARFAVLPISLGLTLNQFSATVMAEIPPIAIPLPVNNDPSAPTPAILLSLDPDFTLSMKTTSLLGSRAKLQDIPKIEQLILGRLRGWIVDNLVWPKVRVLKLPGLGSRGSVEDAADGEGEFVWVEGSTTEKNHGGNSKDLKAMGTICEADEDEGPTSSPSNYDPLRGFVHPPPGPNHSATTQSKYTLHDQHGSVRLPNTPARSPADLPKLVTPSGQQRRPSVKTDARQGPPDSDGYFSQRPPGALPPSDRSTKSFIATPSPSKQNFDNSTSHNERQQQYSQHSPAVSSPGKRSVEERVRWARAGGMTGVPMGLGPQSPTLGFGIRERLRDAERLKVLRNDLNDPFRLQR